MTATRGLRISDCEFRISSVAFWFSAIHLVLRFKKNSAIQNPHYLFPVRLATRREDCEFRIANFEFLRSPFGFQPSTWFSASQKFRNSKSAFRNSLFSLVQREPPLAVERVKSLSLDEVVSFSGNPAQ